MTDDGEYPYADYADLKAENTRLRAALEEALVGWADAAQYKGDYLQEKHGDLEDIARLQAVLTPDRKEES